MLELETGFEGYNNSVSFADRHDRGSPRSVFYGWNRLLRYHKAQRNAGGSWLARCARKGWGYLWVLFPTRVRWIALLTLRGTAAPFAGQGESRCRRRHALRRRQEVACSRSRAQLPSISNYEYERRTPRITTRSLMNQTPAPVYEYASATPPFPRLAVMSRIAARARPRPPLSHASLMKALVPSALRWRVSLLR